jgi:hypothetical protein
MRPPLWPVVSCEISIFLSVSSSIYRFNSLAEKASSINRPIG